MVTKTETTEIVTCPKTQEIQQPSFKRWLKHFFYMPAANRFFNKQDQQAIAQAVTEAEHGHVGEIQVVIEGHIPSNQAYYQNTRARAEQLFAELGVWDTEFNSGVLLYLNLCERQVEIVIDRGIKNATEQNIWEGICQRIIQHMQKEMYRTAMTEGVKEIGNVMDEFYAGKSVDLSNEIANEPIILG
ncbi:TPM domain-containing protein [Acinetobacter sp. ANC 5033]|uniref:TPM domain-containing protein n=1 Tax=Acinetobacter amyesii TaxID=2942470 RepID=UPI00201B6B8D|nr:TPM domain-containing protein [Acinetobacter amyesii]MCL6239702.1 TPM domain-containing protein [Acinetobacter amyesii]